MDEEVLREFRAHAVREKMKMGKALTLAMKRWLREKKKTRINSKILLRVKPFDWVPGSERTSIEVDENLYGSKKLSF